jgi:hypothetical protein
MAPPIGFGWGGHGAMKPAGRLRETLPPHSSGDILTCASAQAAPQGRLSVTGCTWKAKMPDAWWGSRQRSSLR